MQSRFKAIAGPGYNELHPQALYAARAVSNNNSFVYAQLDPGNGKTFGNIQICRYLKDKLNKVPIYVVNNEIL